MMLIQVMSFSCYKQGGGCHKIKLSSGHKHEDHKQDVTINEEGKVHMRDTLVMVLNLLYIICAVKLW